MFVAFRYEINLIIPSNINDNVKFSMILFDDKMYEIHIRYITGHTTYTIWLKNNLPHGETSYYISYFQCEPYIRYSISFKNGMKHGKTKHYHDNGNLMSFEEYFHNLNHGLSMTFSERGLIESIERHFLGKMHGEQLLYKYKCLISVKNYFMGYLHGTSTKYHSDGSIEYINYNYKDKIKN